ncbi:MAG: hypothetical protein K2X68_02020, partial [Novosphingobium sp.]|nr:hypothetical protein [Novosphingobium sp.]
AWGWPIAASRAQKITSGKKFFPIFPRSSCRGKGQERGAGTLRNARIFTSAAELGWLIVNKDWLLTRLDSHYETFFK